MARVQQLLEQHTVDVATPAQLPAADSQRVAALRESGLLADTARQALDRAARRAAEVFDMPLALVTLVDERVQYVGGVSGSIPGTAQRGPPNLSMPRELSICGHVVSDATTVMVEDVARDPRFADNTELRDKGVRFYAGAPLRNPEGLVFGALCLLDNKPRTLHERELQLLESMAVDLMTEFNDEGAESGVDSSSAQSEVASRD